VVKIIQLIKNNKMTKKEDVIEVRRKKMEELEDSGVCLFPNDFVVSHSVKDVTQIVAGLGDATSKDDEIFSLAGRIMAINRFGKTSFIRLRDRTGQIQAYIRKDKIGDEGYSLFKQIDIGDFVGLSGSMFKTRTGEWTLFPEKLKLLCKSTRPLPEKYHGLRDPEKRYRRRYIDLIMNDDVRDIFLKRSKIIQKIRSFLLDRDYLEVETPMMQPVPGGAEAMPFKTYHNALGMDLFLRIAPELYLKRLVVGGFERVFEINRNFRNEGVSTRHNPEFTMLEFYQAYSTYKDLTELTESMFGFVTKEVTGSSSITYQGNSINMAGPWPRITLLKSLEEIGKVDPAILNDKEKLLEFASEKNVNIAKTGRIGKILTKLFDALVEPKLIQPTFITGYPAEVSPLSRKSDEEPDFTERFELFIAGHEIANGFSELNDPRDQKERFIQQMCDREAGDKEAHVMDEDYIEALEYGLPPTAGEGIGIDRLTMLLTDSPSIREVILFPHLKQKERKTK
jgi:lysyl-tRNA synthetase, class II